MPYCHHCGLKCFSKHFALEQSTYTRCCDPRCPGYDKFTVSRSIEAPPSSSSSSSRPPPSPTSKRSTSTKTSTADASGARKPRYYHEEDSRSRSVRVLDGVTNEYVYFPLNPDDDRDHLRICQEYGSPRPGFRYSYNKFSEVIAYPMTREADDYVPQHRSPRGPRAPGERFYGSVYDSASFTDNEEEIPARSRSYWDSAPSGAGGRRESQSQSQSCSSGRKSSGRNDNRPPRSREGHESSSTRRSASSRHQGRWEEQPATTPEASSNAGRSQQRPRQRQQAHFFEFYKVESPPESPRSPKVAAPADLDWDIQTVVTKLSSL